MSQQWINNISINGHISNLTDMKGDGWKSRNHDWTKINICEDNSKDLQGYESHIL